MYSNQNKGGCFMVHQLHRYHDPNQQPGFDSPFLYFFLHHQRGAISSAVVKLLLCTSFVSCDQIPNPCSSKKLDLQTMVFKIFLPHTPGRKGFSILVNHWFDRMKKIDQSYIFFLVNNEEKVKESMGRILEEKEKEAITISPKIIWNDFKHCISW